MSRSAVYVRMDGEVVNVSNLTDAEQEHLEACLAAYNDGVDWTVFSDMVRTTKNPLLRPTGGIITDEVWHHPLFRSIRDMEDRLGIKQGHYGQTMNPNAPLFCDEWIGTTKAAERKGVTLASLHDAMKRGDVIGRTIKPGGTRMEVNVTSLDRWEVDALRQASGRGESTKK